jgi:hypothetical protein
MWPIKCQEDVNLECMEKKVMVSNRHMKESQKNKVMILSG